MACLRDYILIRHPKKKKIKTILHYHCNVEDQIHGSPFGLKFLRKNLKNVDMVFTINEFSRKFVFSMGPRNLNCVLVPNFIEGSFIAFDKDIRSKVRKVIFVGRLVRQKGIEEMILLAKENPEIDFVFVSYLTDEYPDRNMFPGNVTITGNLPMESVKDLMDSSDVFVFPSYTESFSFSLLEAMARGLPVIATDVGSNRDMLENKGGIVIPAKSPNDLLDAFTKILNAENRIAMSKWNIRKVRSSYSSESVVKAIVSHYSSLLSSIE